MSDLPAGDVSATALRQGDLFEDLGPAVDAGFTTGRRIEPAEGGPSVSLAVASGDLIVMGGRAQRDWRHSVPKQATPAGPRISINFAPALP